MIIVRGETCVEVWCKAIISLSEQDHNEAFNVILEINNPIQVSEPEMVVMREFDRLLISKNKQPLHTVSQTIFPDGIYLNEGIKGVFETYPDKIYKRIKHGKWGTYAYRLVRWPISDDTNINQLETLIHKISAINIGEKKFSSCYEVSTHHPSLEAILYDAESDCRARMGRQCLSHLSFKVDFKKDPTALLLTAIYRNHYYFERLLGNMLGLTKLMSFVAKESGIINELTDPVGPLIIHSTHAKIETGKSKILELAKNHLNSIDDL